MAMMQGNVSYKSQILVLRFSTNNNQGFLEK